MYKKLFFPHPVINLTVHPRMLYSCYIAPKGSSLPLVLYHGRILKLAWVEWLAGGERKVGDMAPSDDCELHCDEQHSSAASELQRIFFFFFCLHPDTMKDGRGEENELRLSRGGCCIRNQTDSSAASSHERNNKHRIITHSHCWLLSSRSLSLSLLIRPLKHWEINWLRRAAGKEAIDRVEQHSSSASSFVHQELRVGMGGGAERKGRCQSEATPFLFFPKTRIYCFS